MTPDISVARALFIGFVFFGGIGLFLPITTYLYSFHGRLRRIQLGIAAVSGGLGLAFLLAAGVAKVAGA